MIRSAASKLSLIIEILNSLDKEYCEYLGSIVLFGSYARGNYTIKSDIDIALAFKDNVEEDTIKRAVSKFNLLFDDNRLSGIVNFYITFKSSVDASADILDTNTKIREEGIELWPQSAI